MIQAEHLSDLDQWNFLLRGVVACPEALALCEDATHRGIGIGNPPPKDETANEDNDSGQEALEKIENADCTDAHKVEDGPLNAQICEGLV
jgi:hypothetical protein